MKIRNTRGTKASASAAMASALDLIEQKHQMKDARDRAIAKLCANAAIEADNKLFPGIRTEEPVELTEEELLAWFDFDSTLKKIDNP